jgi:large subunit ribosomal protein L6
MKEEIFLPDGIKSRFENNILYLNKGEIELSKKLYNPLIEISLEGNKILLKSEFENRKAKALLGTFKAHIENMLLGLQKTFSYKLKVVHSHFPINIKVEGRVIKINNFLGEKSPRIVEIVDGVDVKVKGDEIFVQSNDKEKAGLMCSRLENACKKGFRDIRKFQDGIYIVGMEKGD